MSMLDDRARWFRSGDDWCLAPWHAAREAIRSRVVILCPSIGSEHLRGQRAYRVLAERLAASGVSTLRFDYPATGNSTGDPFGASGAQRDLVQRWCESIGDAAAHATTLLPGAEIVLVGRRLGALLAIEATRSIAGTVTRCVLWDPPLSGRAFVRELRLRESARLDQRYAMELERQDPTIALQWDGHRYDRRTVEAIERLTLNDGFPAAEAVDIVATDPDRAVRALESASAERGTLRVAGHRAADAAFDWSTYETAALPSEALMVVERCATDEARPARTNVLLRTGGNVRREILHGAEHAVGEGLVRFGPGDALFGVATAPSSSASPTTAALILPTGIEPSSGYGDMWARFARTAATAGVSTLRMDWRGNGESLSAHGGPENVSYAARRTDDVSEGIAWLRTRFPDARIVVMGLCSGGYYAVHARADGVDVDGVIAINPQLYWQEGMPTQLQPADFAPAVEMQLADGLERAVRDGRKWLRLLRGGYARRDLVRAARGAAVRHGISLRLGENRETSLGGRLPRLDLDRLFPGPTRTHLVFSDDDLGLPHLQAHGRAAYGRLMKRPFMQLHVLEGCDHTCSRESMRRRLDPLLLRLLSAP